MESRSERWFITARKVALLGSYQTEIDTLHGPYKNKEEALAIAKEGFQGEIVISVFRSFWL